VKLSDFDYLLPPELIAHEPVEPRDQSRLMVLNRKTGLISHDYFYNLPNYLNPDDLIVFNQSKVFPARLYGHKETGGKVEVLLISQINSAWKFISRPGLKNGQTIIFDSELRAVVQNDTLEFNIIYPEVMRKIYQIGYTPLPPYINPKDKDHKANISRIYQTVYAKDEGSVAAPTAGFHFTNELLEKIPNKAFVTLHVGLGTFLPVKTENILDHKMHSEYYKIENPLQFENRRVVAVGTTTVRTLETYANTGKTEGQTDIFIYPGYEFKIVDSMITNFHLPKSTLLMLVSAFAGRDFIMQAYQEAIKEKYRFYSFGDAMLIL
jgi:S-adenosylmethionine:tRNA ribosyltransferase-isomerase